MSQLPVAAPLDTDFAGKGADIALSSVVRVINQKADSMGTGFLHSSGRIITAEHVVRGADPAGIQIITSRNVSVQSKNILTDSKFDLAVIELSAPLDNVQPLPLATSITIKIGTLLSTWGFPFGYMGLNPLLAVGYLSGVEQVNGVIRLVVNAAFNSGNSGGPLLHVETGTVIGVVASKLAPLPPYIQNALLGLAQQTSGMQWEATKPDGTKQSISEAQIIAEVLQFLRSQTQLVVGHSVSLNDLQAFLSAHGLPH